MELRQKIEQSLKDAMREKSENKRDALRMVLTALKLKEKENRREPDEAETMQVISTLIKQRRDSADQFRSGGREDLAAKEEDEIRILQDFLPVQLSTDELEKLLSEAISETGATSQKEMGRVMKALMPKVGGRADGKTVNEMVRRKLG